MAADSSDIVAAVSLFISIIAFLVTAAQALQQYAASAEGYTKCQKSVMGNWAVATKRRLILTEFRVDTHFETPVFFLSKPDNKRGPIAGRPIYNMDGSPESYHNTRTMNVAEQRKEQKAASQDEMLNYKKVHTADDERASWVNLLEVIQRAEAESRDWDKKSTKPPKGSALAQPEYSLVVQLQSRRRNWDFMPAGVMRPYATTTISHIAQLATYLGMIWRAFDADNWNLRAEGNGLTITSYMVQGLGLCVNFSITGPSEFTWNKIIPSPIIKELVFGSVPTILDKLSLNLGSNSDIQRTFKALKCKPGIAQRYFERRSHVRSIGFELIGMLGDVVRLRGSNFKMIPNPTADVWNKSLSACTMMEEFQKQLSNLVAEAPAQRQFKAISDSWRNLQTVWKDKEEDIDLDMREAVHTALDSCTAFLLECGPESIIFVVREHIITVLRDLNTEGSFISSQDSDTEEEIFGYYFEHVYPRIMELNVVKQPGNLSAPNSPIEKRGSVLPNALIELRGAIWCSLMFRMVLWWLLHDIEETDVMILPPRLKDSRLPVFIA